MKIEDFDPKDCLACQYTLEEYDLADLEIWWNSGLLTRTGWCVSPDYNALSKSLKKRLAAERAQMTLPMNG